MKLPTEALIGLGLVALLMIVIGTVVEFRNAPSAEGVSLKANRDAQRAGNDAQQAGRDALHAGRDINYREANESGTPSGPPASNDAALLQLIHIGRSIPGKAGAFHSSSLGDQFVARWTSQVLDHLEGDNAKRFVGLAPDNGPDALEQRLRFLEELAGARSRSHAPRAT